MAFYRWKPIMVAISVAAILPAPLFAASPRQILADAAFQARDKGDALSRVIEAENGADAILSRTPSDHEATSMRAMAIGYRAKLEHSRSEALAARKLFESLAAANPRDPEAAAAVGAWHLDSVGELGSFLAGAGLGARKATGIAAMDRAVTLGGKRAMFPGLAGLFRLALDPRDAGAHKLIEVASQGTTPTILDQVMQRSAIVMLATLRTGDRHRIEALARQLLPFGRLKR
jgi:hypothetical protein